MVANVVSMHSYLNNLINLAVDSWSLSFLVADIDLRASWNPMHILQMMLATGCGLGGICVKQAAIGCGWMHSRSSGVFL